ncbi:MAG: hypothetical protein IT373_24550 [Polyangiaceae bacterium]|nr:hypothetical protein [Polyangiaceae bacterium]
MTAVFTPESLTSHAPVAVAPGQQNTACLAPPLVFDIATGCTDSLYLEAQAFFKAIKWVRAVPEVDSLEGMLDYLDTGVDAAEAEVGVGAVHILLSGAEGDLRFRLRSGEDVRIYELPMAPAAQPELAGRILPKDIMPLYRRPRPRACQSGTRVALHGCTTGDALGVSLMWWCVLGHTAIVSIPRRTIVYDVRVQAAAVNLDHELVFSRVALPAACPPGVAPPGK